ncbi:MAG TPA: ABC transporter permease [Candidatus Dormibacteraeota bacterium]
MVRAGGFMESARSVLSYRESGVLVALVAITGAMFVISPTFRDPYNLTIILIQMSVIAIMAMGQTLVIISGAFDLSQGPVSGLVAMVTGMMWSIFGADPAVAITAGIATGAACGLANGVLAARFKLHPIVMTLATSTIFTGLNYFITRGRPVIGLPDPLLEPGAGNVGPVPTPVVIMLVVTIVMQFLLTRTLFGLRVRQVGGNLEAARRTGVNVSATWLAVFVISGILSAIGGIVELGRVGNAIPSIGLTLLFPIISSAIIGGTLLTGGSGSMVGTLLGAATLTVINNALVVLQVDIYVQDVFQGALVVVALVIDQFRRRELTVRDLIRSDL